MNNSAYQLKLRFSFFVWIIGLSLILFSCHQTQRVDEEKLLIPLVTEALGDNSFPISTDEKRVQLYFDQGLQLGYAFGRGDAKRSFMEAQKIDSNCAMCFWGEAWTRGPYLNNQKQLQKGTYQSIKKAVELADAGYTNNIETALIQALKTRYNKADNLDNRTELDSTYAREMGLVYQQYPNNPDVATLYAEALFLLEPRMAYRDVDDPDVQRIIQVLESTIKNNGMHPGACHFYIHILESSNRPEKALSCAEYIGNSIPGASHINHMPSHIYNRLGQWGKSVEVNLKAWHTDQKAREGEAFAIYPDHNLRMLSFVASMNGQGAIAIQAAKDAAKISGNHMYHALALIRFGRFDEVIHLNSESSDLIPSGILEFALGYASLKLGDMDNAQDILNRLKKMAQNSEAGYRSTPSDLLLGTIAHILEGEIYRERKQMAEAVNSFKKAVSLYDQLGYSEPETLPFSARHWLGSIYLNLKDYQMAETVYRKELEQHPNNGWSLYGLMKSLEGQNKSIVQIKNQFEESWKRSEVWIESARF